MQIWIAIILIVILARVIYWSRMNIPRDLTREKPDDHESTQAYDRVSRWPLFSIIRYYFMRQLKKHRPQGTLIDAGCGPGYLALMIAQRFPGLQVTAVDLSPEMLDLAAQNRSLIKPIPRVTLQVADIQQLPLPSNSMDFAVSTLSLHHWADASAALKEIYRVLKPNGQLLIFDLRRDAPRSLFYLIRYGQRWLAPIPIRRVNGGEGSFWSSFTPNEMERLLSASPFPFWGVRKGWGWAYIEAKKGQSQL